jgi:hypothetical protein
MKAEIQFDISQLAIEITQEVIRALKPILTTKVESDDIIFSAEELADYLRVSAKWVYDNTYELPHFKLGGLLRCRKKDIDRVIDQLSLKVKLNKVATT